MKEIDRMNKVLTESYKISALDIKFNSSFRDDFYFDSIDWTEFIMRMEEELEIDIDEGIFSTNPTVQEFLCKLPTIR